MGRWRVRSPWRAFWALCAAALGAAVIVLVFFGDDEERSARRDGEALFPGLHARSLTRLTVRTDGEPTVIEPLAPADGGTDALRGAEACYRIVSGRALEADDVAVRALLARLEALAVLREGAPAEVPGGAFDAPAVALAFDAAQGTWTLELGGAVEGGASLVRARAPGQRSPLVGLIRAHEAEAIVRDARALREGRLLRGSLRGATALRLERATAQVSLLRGHDGAWSLGGLVPADEVAIDALLVALESLRAEPVARRGAAPADHARGADGGPLGAEGVRVRVDVGAVVHRLAFSRTATGEARAENLASGAAAAVSEALWERLARPMAAWRRTRALRFIRGAVASIRWSRGGALSLVTRLKSGEWYLLAPKQGRASSAAVDRLLAALEGLAVRTPDEASGAPLGRAPEAPALEIALDDVRGVPLDALRLGPASGGAHPARSERWPTGFLVDAAAVKALPFDTLVAAPPPTPRP